jgi:hypothetical protein
LDIDQDALSELQKIAAAGPSDSGLSRLSEMGGRLHNLDTDIKALELQLTDLKNKRQDITEREMPDLFDEVGTDRIGLPEAGVDLILKPYYHAVLSKDDPELQEAGFKWLEENGHGDIIKATLTVEFTRGELERAKELQAKVQQLTNQPVRIEMGVHWKTLTGFVKEQLERYQAVLPLGLLGATVGRVVKIEKRKN